MIKYLAVEEKAECRLLWEEAFPEDSRPFDDYYFTEKLKDNRILALEEDGEVTAMLHQNPYCLSVRGMTWQSDYLVGVATRTDRRHRGYMRQLLNHMMHEMWQEQMPFCFLMPADEAIYRPFGFTYIFDQPHVELVPEISLEVRDVLSLADSIGERGYLAWLGNWIEQWLERHYQVFAKRDELYLHRLFSELKSEQGTFEILYDEDTMIGIKSTWGLKTQEQRLLYCEPGYWREEKPATPAIMARIICMEQFVKVIRLKPNVKQEELTLVLQVEDPIVAENHGIWNWHINHETSWLVPWDENGENSETIIKLSIDQLTGWLFGYQVPESVTAHGDVVAVLQGVFLDEIV